MNVDNEAASGLDFLKRLRNRWPLAIGMFLTIFACTAGAIWMIPAKYEAKLKVVIKNDRIDPLVGADKQTQGIFYVNDVSEPRINTEIQLLTSSKVLREVVTRCHLADEMQQKGRSDSQRVELALQKLTHELSVSAVRNSNVIEVSYESVDPHRSAEVVNAVWQSYASSSRVMHGVPGSLVFFEHLSATYDGLLADAQASLAEFRTIHHVVSLPEEQTLALANDAHLSSQMADSSAAKERSAAAATHLKGEIASMPERVERERRSMPNQALTQQLTSLLVTLENKRTEASMRYRSTDRLMTELDTQIAQTEKSLAEASRTTANEVSVAANPAIDVAKSEYLRSTAESAGAQAQTAELSRQLRRNRASLDMLTTEAADYKRLVQRVTEMEETAGMYHRRTEDARLEQMLDEQRISNVSVLDEPYVPSLPHSPKRGLLLFLGFLWSVTTAMITAAIVEMMATRVQSASHCIEATGSPLLANVPPSARWLDTPSFPSLYMAMQRSKNWNSQEVQS